MRNSLKDKTIEPDSSHRKKHGRTIAVRVVWYVAGIILTLLAFRFVLPLLGANLNTGFANGIFQLTSPFVSPFSGLFENITVDRVIQFEPNVLVAMAVYAIVALGLVKLIDILR